MKSTPKRPACLDHDPELFYPAGWGTPSEIKQAEDAKAICRTCPLIDDCLRAALAKSSYHDHGVWGGTTKPERDIIRRSRVGKAAA